MRATPMCCTIVKQPPWEQGGVITPVGECDIWRKNVVTVCRYVGDFLEEDACAAFKRHVSECPRCYEAATIGAALYEHRSLGNRSLN